MSADLSGTLSEPSAQALAELSTIILGEKPLDLTLQRIAEIAVRAVPAIDEASVTLMGDRQRVRTVVFTGALAVDLDERQYASGFGPCLDAAEAAATVVVEVGDRDTPYPGFAALAARVGVQQIVSVGLPVQQNVIGALNLYSRRHEPHDRATLSLAETLAGYVGAVVANAARYSSAAELAEHMQQAMRSRAVIEQAKGILMARSGCTSEKAFVELTRMSQRSNRKLRDLATDLVTATVGRPPEAG